MQKTEYRALARVGAVESLRTMESRLGQLFTIFPDLFIGNMRPQFLKPELQNGSAPTWPEFTRRETTTGKPLPPPGGGKWTAKRRKEQAARRRQMLREGKMLRRSASTVDEAKREYQRKYRLRMKRKRAAENKQAGIDGRLMKVRKGKKGTGRAHRVTRSGPVNFFDTMHEKIYVYLAKHPGDTVSQIAKGLGEAHPANCTKPARTLVDLGLATRDPKTLGFSQSELAVGELLKTARIKPRETT